MRRTLRIEITKNIVTLFRERQFVNGMSNVTRFQHGGGVFSRVIAIDEPIDMLEQPIDQIRTYGSSDRMNSVDGEAFLRTKERSRNGNLQPYTIAYIEARI